jgi:CrcB protein
MLAVAVALAAGVGSLCRYLFDRSVQRRLETGFPIGTLVVNLSGSFLLGLVTGLASHHGLADNPTTVLSAGFTGGYTTFSTWIWESLALGEAGAIGAAGVNIVGSLALGIAAAAAGLGLALI